MTIVKWFYSNLSFLLGILLVFNIVFPLFREDAHAEEINSPFDYIDLNPSGNTLGNSIEKRINESFYINWIKDNFDWELQNKPSSTSTWITRNDLLNVIKDYDDVNLSWKISLEISNTDHQGIYGDYRFILACNDTNIEYVDLDNNNLIINKSWNDGNYSLYFNYSDILEIPNIITGKGVKNGFHYFFCQKNNVLNSKYILIDPTFGDIGEYTSDLALVDNRIIHFDYTTGGTAGTLDTGHAFMKLNLASDYVRMSVYDMSFNLIAVSDQQEIDSAGYEWFTFNFNDEEVDALTDYYISIWGSGGVPSRLAYENYGTENYYRSLETYHATNPPEDPEDDEGLIDSTTSASIYCTYTEAVSLEWHDDQSDINGIIYNLTWHEDQSDINGIIYNLTWHEDQSDINGIIYNLTWYEDQSDINGIIYNLTWYEDQSDINGTIYNISDIAWHEDQSNINGTIYNISDINWNNDQDDINGTIYNISDIAWHEDQSNINGTIYNISEGAECDCSAIRTIVIEELENYNALKESDEVDINISMMVASLIIGIGLLAIAVRSEYLIIGGIIGTANAFIMLYLIVTEELAIDQILFLLAIVSIVVSVVKYWTAVSTSTKAKE